MHARTAGATSPFPSQRPPCYNPPATGPALATVCPIPRGGAPTVNQPEQPLTDSPEKDFSQTTSIKALAEAQGRPYALYSPRSRMYALTAAGASSPSSTPFRAHSRSAVALTST